jgi:hypothetical protein
VQRCGWGARGAERGRRGGATATRRPICTGATRRLATPCDTLQRGVVMRRRRPSCNINGCHRTTFCNNWSHTCNPLQHTTCFSNPLQHRYCKRSCRHERRVTQVALATDCNCNALVTLPYRSAHVARTGSCNTENLAAIATRLLQHGLHRHTAQPVQRPALFCNGASHVAIGLQRFVEVVATLRNLLQRLH